MFLVFSLCDKALLLCHLMIPRWLWLDTSLGVRLNRPRPNRHRGVSSPLEVLVWWGLTVWVGSNSASWMMGLKDQEYQWRQCVTLEDSFANWEARCWQVLFTISMDQITSLSLSKDSKIILYPDDILLYKPIRSHNDAIALQSDINMVTNWFSDCGLKLNPAKTKFMLVSRKHFPPNLSVCIKGTLIIQVESLKYLGVTITSDNWSTHINSTAPKLESSSVFYI